MKKWVTSKTMCSKGKSVASFEEADGSQTRL